MGRVTSQTYCLPDNCANRQSASAAYDLAGNMTDLRYPDGRHITQTWDAENRLQTINLADINGVAANQNYLQSIVYNPDGSPNVTTLGNGAAQQVMENNRLQISSMSISNSNSNSPFSGQSFLSRSYCYVCGTGNGGNNGNIWQITDNQNSARTQSFTYDSLNRISSFSLGGTLNQQYQIDSFGNMSPLSGGNPLYTFDSATNRINNLPCAASMSNQNAFDSGGNQLCDTDTNGAVRTYTFDAENRTTGITIAGNQAPFESYAYSADGARVRKLNANNDYTEYVNFGGQTIAEKDQTGAWTDYIFANGKRIAKTTNNYQRLHLTGSSCGANAEADWNIASNSTPISSGDRMVWHEEHADGQQSYLKVQFSNNVWMFEGAMDPQGGVWQTASVDLSPWAGDSTWGIWIAEIADGSGSIEAKITDLALVKADGTVYPFFDGQTGVPGATSFGCGTSSVVSENVPVEAGASTIVDTKFYVGDHLGTAQMEFSSGGWPVWQGQFAPFGQELDTQTTSNHYKFTGKERDAESGLDYFGARYYGSSMGRFISPDWSANQDPVPYARLDDPQSLNLYTYGGNNPLIHIDADGHCWPQWLCNFATEVKNKVLHGEFTTDTNGAKIRQLDRQEAKTRQMNRIMEEMKQHPPKVSYGIVAPVDLLFLLPRATQGTTYLYQKLGPNGEHLKYGITNDPEGRYTKSKLNGGMRRQARKSLRSPVREPAC